MTSRAVIAQSSISSQSDPEANILVLPYRCNLTGLNHISSAIDEKEITWTIKTIDTMNDLEDLIPGS